MNYALKYSSIFWCLFQSKKQLHSVRQFAQQLNAAATPEHIQSHWHLQQWWVLIAGFFLFASILIFAFTHPISPTKIEADYLREVDPQIYALLEGQMLSPPPEVEDSLIEEAIIAATNIESAQPSIQAEIFNPNVEDVHMRHSHADLASADRNPERQNSLTGNRNITYPCQRFSKLSSIWFSCRCCL